jgi:hypothetical protein
MARYKRIVKTHTVDAHEFTSALAAEIMDFKPTEDAPKHLSGIEYEEGRGYTFVGQRLSFGCFFGMGPTGEYFVSNGDDFRANYEKVGK